MFKAVIHNLNFTVKSNTILDSILHSVPMGIKLFRSRYQAVPNICRRMLLCTLKRPLPFLFFDVSCPVLLSLSGGLLEQMPPPAAATNERGIVRTPHRGSSTYTESHDMSSCLRGGRGDIRTTTFIKQLVFGSFPRHYNVFDFLCHCHDTTPLWSLEAAKVHYPCARDCQCCLSLRSCAKML